MTYEKSCIPLSHTTAHSVSYIEETGELLIAQTNGEIHVLKKNSQDTWIKTQTIIFTDEKRYKAAPSSVSYIGGQRFIASGEDGLLILFEQNGTTYEEHPLPKCVNRQGFLIKITDTDVSPLKQIAALTEDGDIFLYEDTLSGYEKREIILLEEKDTLYDVLFFDEDTIVSGGESGTLYIHKEEASHFSLYKKIMLGATISHITKNRLGEIVVSTRSGKIWKIASDFQAREIYQHPIAIEVIEQQNTNTYVFADEKGAVFCLNNKTSESTKIAEYCGFPTDMCVFEKTIVLCGEYIAHSIIPHSFVLIEEIH